jgi:hypothetical protein
MPRLPRELIEHAVREQPDMAVVGIADDDGQLDAVIQSVEPEIVILGSGRSFAPNCRCVFRYPGVRVIALDQRSGHALLCERVGIDIALTDVVKAVRHAASRPPLLDNGSA